MRLLNYIIVVLLLFSIPASADIIIINGSTTPAWNRTGYDNTTISDWVDSNNNIIINRSFNPGNDFFTETANSLWDIWPGLTTSVSLNSTSGYFKRKTGSIQLIESNGQGALRYDIANANYSDYDFIYFWIYMNQTLPWRSDGYSVFLDTAGTNRWSLTGNICTANTWCEYRLYKSAMSNGNFNAVSHIHWDWDTSPPPLLILIDGLYFGKNITTGNTTHWYNSGTGNEVNRTDIFIKGNFSACTGDNSSLPRVCDVYYGNLNTTDSGAWNNRTIDITTKYQDFFINITKLGNLTTTSEETEINIYTQALPPSPSYMPPSPINLSCTNGNFWRNCTWEAGAGNVTNSYNTTVNGTFINSTQPPQNITTSAHGWVNRTIRAFNASGNGTENQTALSDNFQIPNNPPALNNISDIYVFAGEWVNITLLATDADGDTLTNQTNATNGTLSGAVYTWLTTETDVGTHYLGFNASDGYAGIDNKTAMVVISSGIPAGKCSAFQSGNMVYSGNCTNITQVSEELVNSSLLDNEGSGIWLLNSNLTINSTTNFHINETDATWVKINSTNPRYSYIQNSGGHLEINKTKITSWNATSSSFTLITTNLQVRPYVTTTSGGYTNVTNSNLSHLGFYDTSIAYGQSFALSYMASFGTVSNNTFIGNWRVVFEAGSNNNLIENNTIINDGGVTETSGFYILGNGNVVRNNNINITSLAGQDTPVGLWVNNAANNTFTNNTINLQGNSALGIYYHNNPSNNSFINDTVSVNSGSSPSAVYIGGGHDNMVSGGTINPSYILYSNVNNTFIDVPFNSKTIDIRGAGVSFNYSNNSIWLNTSNATQNWVSTRTLVNNSGANFSWSETLTASRELRYDLSGLPANNSFSIYNDTVIDYNLTTDANGVLPSFIINFTTSTKTVKILQIVGGGGATGAIPPDPINLTQTNSSVGFWINYTWTNGTGNTTDSYNVSVNGTWTNGSANNFSNGTVAAHGWRNATVYAWNSSGNGNLSNGNVSMNTQIPNNAPVLTPIGDKFVNEGNWLNFTALGTDADNDPLTYDSNSTLFPINSTTGNVNVSLLYNQSGVYNVSFNATDNNSGVSFSNITITVNNTTPIPVSSCSDALNIDGEFYNVTATLNSTGTCLTVGAANITLDGKGYTLDFASTTNGYGIVNSGYSNVTVKNFNIVMRVDPGAGTSNGIRLVSASNGNITNNTIELVNAATKTGIFLNTGSSNNVLINNRINGGYYGVGIQSSSNNNTVRDGSIHSNGVDYFVQTGASTNRFIDTNFTTRTVQIATGNEWFNYSNNSGQIWVSTQTAGMISTRHIDRTLINWNQSNMTWQDDYSFGAFAFTYDINGLVPNTNYSIYNGTVLESNLTTNSSGDLPQFSINHDTTPRTVSVLQVITVAEADQSQAWWIS